jgi:hypothetical protein
MNKQQQQLHWSSEYLHDLPVNTAHQQQHHHHQQHYLSKVDLVEQQQQTGLMYSGGKVYIIKNQFFFIY